MYTSLRPAGSATGYGPGAVYWDGNNDGFREASGWVGPEDGLLCIDRNGNGAIDNNGELFGNNEWASQGFEMLAAYDSNADGKITSADAQFSKLRVWIDGNGDGVSQASELKTLSSLGITQINLAHSDVNLDANGNTIRAEGTFVMNGVTRLVQDVILNSCPTNTVYNGDYTLDVRTLFLPDQRGYGTLPDLHVAMSGDAALLALVQDLATKTQAQLFDPAFDLDRKLGDILFRWAGVQGLTGLHVTGLDARIVAFLEKFSGMPFTNGNPAAAGGLTEAWIIAKGTIAGNLLMQSGLGGLYHNPVYDAASDTLSGGDGSRSVTLRFDTPGIHIYADDATNNIYVFSKNGSPAGGGWQADYITSAMTVDSVNDVDTLLFTDVLPGDVRMWSDSRVLHIQYSPADRVDVQIDQADAMIPTLERIVFASTGAVWDLTRGFPMIDTDDGHSLMGTAANDSLDARGGNDYLYGYGGNDTLNGGRGQDILVGGAGDDVYVFRAGDSPAATPDILDEYQNEGTDTLKLTGGILPGSVRMWSNYGELTIQYSASDVIRVQAYQDPSTGASVIQTQLERIVFDNGTVWDLTKGLLMTDTDDAHQIIGTDLNDTVDGRGGNDQISGMGGNDILYGGAGQDSLTGGKGDDTYVFRAGESADSARDTVSEGYNEGVDTIKLTGGILPSAVTMEAINGSIFIHYSPTDTISVQTGYDPLTGATLPWLEKILFDNGTVWDLTKGLPLNGTAGADTMNGTDLVDIMSGGGGNDTLYGRAGNDTLDGGAGNDRLEGGVGGDKYVYASGGGSDTIYDEGGTDRIALGSGFTLANVTLERSGMYDMLIRSAGQTLFTVLGQFNGSGAIEAVYFADGTSLNLLTYSHTLNGTGGDDTLYGVSFGGGGDRINGLGGNDYVFAGLGDDTVTGGDGNDTIYGEDGNDILYGNAGDDYVNGGAGNDTIVYDGGADNFYDGGGTDTISIATAGITSANMTLARPAYSPYDLEIRLNGALAFTLHNQFAQDQGFETIRFANGSTFNLLNVSYPQNGTSGADTLYGIGFGGNPNDTINGNAGDDTIYGYEGNDTLAGGKNNDTIDGGAGDDVYIYNSGDGVDHITDAAGNDTIQTGSGFLKTDLTWARSAAMPDALILSLKGVQALVLDRQFAYQGSGVETVKFADGSTVALTAPAFTLNGTAGDDSLTGVNYNASPDDTINGLGGNDSIYGNDGNDVLNGGAGNDTLYGGFGNDTFLYNAGDGADILNDQGGADVIQIGAGFVKGDLTYRQANIYDLELLLKGSLAMTVQNHFSPGYAIETVRFADGSTVDLTNMALTFNGTSGSESLTGTDLSRDTLNGQAGNDWIYAYGRDDVLNGGAGTDILFGGAGNDTYLFRAGDSPLAAPDTVNENAGEGTDTIKLTGGILPSAVNMWIDGYTLHIRYTAGDEIAVQSGIDPVAGATAIGNYVERIVFDNGTVWDLTKALVMTDTADGHTMLGSGFGDALNGAGGADYIYGYGGNDSLTGGAGNDYLYGGTGDDTYFWQAGHGADYITDEGGAADVLRVAGMTSESLNFSMGGIYDVVIASAASSADSMTLASQTYSAGTYIIETLRFDDGFALDLSSYASWTAGGSTADTLLGDVGGTRNDTILGRAGNDTLKGYAGDDTLAGDSGNDKLYGGNGNDSLHGGSGTDTLYGEAGNDALWGGAGADTLYGGAGADRFILDGSTAASDTIADFNRTEDVIDLSVLLPSYDPATQAIVDFIQITDSGTSSIVKVDLDGKGTAYTWTQVATIAGVTGLTDEQALATSGNLVA